MSFYSFPYLILILTYVVIHFYEKSQAQLKSKAHTRFFCAAIFIFFFGFRGLIGSDWFNYDVYYSETTLSSWRVFDHEIAFAFLAKLFHDLDFSYETFVLFITVFQVFLWDRFLKRESQNISLAYVVLISIFPLLVIDLLRNFTAILIAIQSIEYIKKDRKIKALAFILASITFHLTGIFFLLFFFIYRSYLKRWFLIILSLLGISIYFLRIRFLDSIIFSIGNLLGGKYEFLAQGIVESNLDYGIRFGIVEKLVVLALVLANYKTIKRNKIISPLYFNVFFCYCFILLFFNNYETMINRFSLLFFWGYLMIFSNLKSIINHSKLKRVIVIPIVLLCLLKAFATFNIELYKYSNVLFGADSFYDRKSIRDEHYKK